MYNSSNPFPSSVHGFPPLSSSFYDHEKDGVYSHHHHNHHNNHHNHHPFVAGDCSATVAPPLVIPPSTKASEVVQQYGGTTTTTTNNNNSNSNSNHFSDLMVSNFPSKNRVSSGSKKDRHSKIFTAQGPRDRRVRLSIDISRKFFGLQDLLGFDRASKTLDWLFTKSKTAIKDLVEEMKQQHTSSSTLTDQCEVVFMGKDQDRGHLDNKNVKTKSKKPVPKCGNGTKRTKTKKPTQQKHGFLVNLAARSKSRAEARARARERTIEKLQKLRNYESKINVVDYCYHLQSNCGNNQIQSSSNQEIIKIGESSSSSAAIEQKLPKPYSLMYSSQFKNSTTH